ncbi:MAG: GntR family transcriptional regulator [Micrococcales bacterium]|nr:GntR family transcriptional regulator [Micrococcales bacterium]
MLWRIDPSIDEPLYSQIVAQVYTAILNGEIGLGERLPAARNLAEGLGLNMHTVLRAYGELRDEGIIALKRGRGAVVVAGKPHGADIAQVRAALTAFAEAVRNAGLTSGIAATMVRQEFAK